MILLLDTHAFIWFVENDYSLPVASKNIIQEKSNTLFLSIVSLWEITIKVSLKKLEISRNIEEIIELIPENGFEILPIFPPHLIELSCLPFHHRDPFDRLLVAQAKSENVHFISRDEILDKYEIKRIWQHFP